MVDARVDQILRWDPVNAAVGYTIQLSSAGVMVASFDVDQPGIEMSELCAGQPVDAEYTAVVKARSAFGDSGWTEPFVFMLRVLDTPRGLRLK